ncbi:lysine N(6)-hydroxylase/L-ornithine N(5)-oxygenase family protein [Actinoplanes sp. N902-109]|uniref:lysine N(6)-hydroxylase/L-ornithine N(5)-oxygenase family protein n=1 Tax=Actinoplanes sp. (strain N902-109) TaxID=649831 RepID=UPI0003293CA7|nr:lysine N(6)-hydroxylase/L-ornithine N(5)-oxygenase family protein [Actinoplanes sp. N902-109]AGL15092.1 Siderophore biosynthesis protein, monooxygenase [Actinoplanes sp. N902-109]
MSEPVLDVVGIGFGPSNLALAIAVAEHNAAGGPRVTTRFLERQATFGWHRGMLLDDATMQVSFLKDLVTLRNPTSGFSFLRYLHSRGRLIDFINHKNLFPLRAEFHDYFGWAAAQVGDQVTYAAEVVSVTPVDGPGGQIEAVDVVSRQGGRLSTHRARNLVIGTGLRPRLPEGVTASQHIWHTSDLLHNLPRIRGTRVRRFVVVGAGQSAAETVATLHTEFPEAEVCAVFSRYGYSPADDSSFANRIFDPQAVDEFYRAPEDVKRQLMDYHGNTNYSVVDIDLINDLYRRAYQEKVLGRERLRMLNMSRMVHVSDTPDGAVAGIQSLVTGETTTLEADVVVCATGYHQADPYGVLGAVGDLCARDDQGRPRAGRDYRAATDERLRVGIYLQGGTEHTHGITSALLSNTAIRVGEILDSIVARRTAPALVTV